MISQKKPLVLFSVMILLAGNLVPVFGQTSSNYMIKLSLAPNHIESESGNYNIGFLYLFNSAGIPVKPSQDIEIHLSSERPEIASVPEKVIYHTNDEFIQFDVTVGKNSGETEITATIDGRSDFAKLSVGVDKSYLPDDATLELNIPTEVMHVNSEMPFTVYLRTADGSAIRAPYDIPITLNYEKSLLHLDSDELTIKKGEYYAWETLHTTQNVGNAYLRVSQADAGLNSAKSIKISSTLPTSLAINVFPDSITASNAENKVDIFVSLVDSDGNPSVAHEDVKLTFFSNDQSSVGEKLSETTEQLNPVIKKGEFGYYLRQDLNLSKLTHLYRSLETDSAKIQDTQVLLNDIEIGVSAKGYGVATDSFSTVGTSLNIDDAKVSEKKIQLFVPERMPTNATSMVTYQVMGVEDDADDKSVNGTDTTSNTSVSEGDKQIILSIDDLGDGELYPIQVNENYYADGHVKKLNVLSADNNLVSIKKIGPVEVGHSFGTATISSGQKSGSVLISASIDGVGSESIPVEVINTLEQKSTILFSPLGKDTVLFDRDGYFDVFVMAIDENDRPKDMREDSKYLISPTNQLVTIPKDNTFTFIKLQSDSFSVEPEQSISFDVVPIGINADESMKSSNTFHTQPSSMVKVMIPNNSLNIKNANNVGVVQLVDLQENPISTTKPLKTKIVSSDSKIVQINTDAVIEEGQSYSFFPIETTEKMGTVTISASAKGVLGSSAELKTVASLINLKIYTSGVEEKLTANKEYQVKISIDDENANSVDGISIKTEGNERVTVSPNMVKTDSNGNAFITVTPLKGPDASFDLTASGTGYKESKITVDLTLDSATTQNESIADLALPDWIGYVVGVALAFVGILVFLFLKKSKKATNEEEEEEILSL